MLRIALVIAIAVVPAAAEAQSYRCIGKDGKKYYGQSMPMECLGQPVEQLNAQGMVVKRHDAAASAAEREKKAADEEERKKREVANKEEGRRNRALLATYTSEKDIDSARGRALADNQAAAKDIESKIVGLRKRQDDLRKELDFFQGKNKPPAKLGEDIKNAEFDLGLQEGELAKRKKDVNSINARYDDDMARYRELTGLDVRQRAGKLEEAKSVTTVSRPDKRAISAHDQREADARARRDQAELRRLEGGRGASDAADLTRHTVMCGKTTIVCTARSTVTCGGRVVPCQ